MPPVLSAVRAFGAPWTFSRVRTPRKMHATSLYSHRLQPQNIAFAGTKRVIPMPARVANQNTGFTSSCPLAVSEEY